MIELTGEDGQKSWPIVVIFFGSERDTAKDEIKMLNSLEAEMEELATKINIVTTPQEAKKEIEQHTQISDWITRFKDNEETIRNVVDDYAEELDDASQQLNTMTALAYELVEQYDEIQKLLQQ
ncbi:hypothetical protein LRY65_04895 [Candidatus Woesebacteria bacterium]|nr:hypothetical protein [Candidatus Woesebacteria bacterium]